VIFIKNNLITIFNQLTSDELADYNLFVDLLENHYEKVKYLYYLLNGIKLKKINKIYCSPSQTSINVKIEPDDNRYINEIIYRINSNKKSYMFSDFFDVDIIEEREILKIDIRLKNGTEEADIYASRLI